ncbi:MAG: glycosyltransferase family A protein, partial [Betaproteobacteria bacterium]
MSADPQAGVCADIALATRHTGRINVGTHDDADLRFDIGGELPFADRAVASLHLGDAIAELRLRDQVQLLLECRRVLAPQGRVLLIEARAARLHVQLARWAALVGLLPLPAGTESPGWSKTGAGGDPGPPLVSIAIPSSNPRYFGECVDSALAQTYPHVEIVICDDSDGDAIPGMVAARTGQKPIRYEKNAPRLRARLNYEKCLSLARGDYVKFLNDDDVLEPTCVARL